jgi:putative transposase
VRSCSDEEFGAKVCASFIFSYRTYCARRIWHDLLAGGLSCGLNRVERLMRVHGLKARPRRRGLPKDEGQRSGIADNVLDRQFTADGPNQKWVAELASPPFGSPKSGPPKAGSMSQPSSTSSHAAWLDGR